MKKIIPDRYRNLLKYWWMLPLGFYGMEILHEAGHVIAGLLSGAAVKQIHLLPWELSQTEFSVNPHPGIVAWSGFAGGIAFSLLPYILFRQWGDAFLLRFFAGFCLIANGLYIGIGCFFRLGDCLDILNSGTSFWLMPLAGFVAVAAGLRLWHKPASA